MKSPGIRLCFGGTLISQYSLFTCSIFGVCRACIAAHGLSLVAESGGSSLAVVLRLLSDVASPVSEHGLQR